MAKGKTPANGSKDPSTATIGFLPVAVLLAPRVSAASMHGRLAGQLFGKR